MSKPFNVQNVVYIENLFEAFLADPSSVAPEWQLYFNSMSRPGAEAQDILAPCIPSSSTQTVRLSEKSSHARPSMDGDPAAQKYPIRDSIRALMMIRNYRVRGHLHANLDPLGLEKRSKHAELDPVFYGFSESDYDRPIYMDGVLGFETATMGQILEKLENTYTKNIGFEFMHIQDPDRKNWIQEHIESIPFTLKTEQKKKVLKDLVRAEYFEKFLHNKFQGAKRFGLDGGETLIPALEYMVDYVAGLGITDLVVGMSHRGRLSVLTNIIGKPYRKLFAKFLNTQEDPYALGSGDVKYHLGYSGDRQLDGHNLHLSLVSNPSHLEAVDPVVLGKVRAEQMHHNDHDRKKIMGLLMHGDAAFAGQGLVAETLELSDLNGYRTGGTVHVIVNNQIGFTTSPPHSRSSPYCTDIAKGIQAPIFHANADDPESVLRVFHLALEYRHKFQQDVVLDMICYRRYGHNESDEPSFTQPLMYKAIAAHPTTSTLYEKKLIQEGVVDEAEAATIREEVQAHLDQEHQKAVNGDDCFEHPHWLKGLWQGIEAGNMGDLTGDDPKTGVEAKTIKSLAEKLTTVPEDFNINSKIKRQLGAKDKMISSGEGIDWAMGEALAFASLLNEGHHVRLSGQDCGRGTFSHRHAVLVDQESEKKYVPLDYIANKQGDFEVIDSPLAEASVLGFEYGYSGASPNNLVLWEGQFGDFSNGAQVIIDQFLSSGEMKWSRQNGLVMLLPHGFEGQGPEHSSARLERFLQMCAEGNWYVANCSTPANYFHILRRQLKQTFRKPLILMTPKSLLRHKLCTSTLAEFEKGTSFTPVYGDDKDPSKVTKVILCSGKVYYDLLAETLEHNHEHVALMRLEQFYPFPEKELISAMKAYKNASFYWCQEEPENMGAWHFVDRRFEKALMTMGARSSRPFVIARPAAASPATGLLTRHEQEQKDIIKRVFEDAKRITLSAMK